jgi:type II secretory pathway pseudopilin PulG
MTAAQGGPANTTPEGSGTSKVGMTCIAILVVLVIIAVALPILGSRLF